MVPLRANCELTRRWHTQPEQQGSMAAPKPVPAASLASFLDQAVGSQYFKALLATACSLGLDDIAEGTFFSSSCLKRGSGNRLNDLPPIHPPPLTVILNSMRERNLEVENGSELALRALAMQIAVAFNAAASNPSEATAALANVALHWRGMFRRRKSDGPVRRPFPFRVAFRVAVDVDLARVLAPLRKIARLHRAAGGGTTSARLLPLTLEAKHGLSLRLTSSLLDTFSEDVISLFGDDLIQPLEDALDAAMVRPTAGLPAGRVDVQQLVDALPDWNSAPYAGHLQSPWWWTLQQLTETPGSSSATPEDLLYAITAAKLVRTLYYTLSDVPSTLRTLVEVNQRGSTLPGGWGARVCEDGLIDGGSAGQGLPTLPGGEDGGAAAAAAPSSATAAAALAIPTAAGVGPTLVSAAWRADAGPQTVLRALLVVDAGALAVAAGAGGQGGASQASGVPAARDDPSLFFPIAALQSARSTIYRDILTAVSALCPDEGPSKATVAAVGAASAAVAPPSASPVPPHPAAGEEDGHWVCEVEGGADEGDGAAPSTAMDASDDEEDGEAGAGGPGVGGGSSMRRLRREAWRCAINSADDHPAFLSLRRLQQWRCSFAALQARVLQQTTLATSRLPIPPSLTALLSAAGAGPARAAAASKPSVAAAKPSPLLQGAAKSAPAAAAKATATTPPSQQPRRQRQQQHQLQLQALATQLSAASTSAVSEAPRQPHASPPSQTQLSRVGPATQVFDSSLSGPASSSSSTTVLATSGEREEEEGGPTGGAAAADAEAAWGAVIVEAPVSAAKVAAGSAARSSVAHAAALNAIEMEFESEPVVPRALGSSSFSSSFSYYSSSSSSSLKQQAADAAAAVAAASSANTTLSSPLLLGQARAASTPSQSTGTGRKGPASVAPSASSASSTAAGVAAGAAGDAPKPRRVNPVRFTDTQAVMILDDDDDEEEEEAEGGEEGQGEAAATQRMDYASEDDGAAVAAAVSSSVRISATAATAGDEADADDGEPVVGEGEIMEEEEEEGASRRVAMHFPDLGDNNDDRGYTQQRFTEDAGGGGWASQWRR